MPYLVKKVRNEDAYMVVNRLTGKKFSKHTTKEKAKAQVRLLEGIEHGTIKK